jgi:hypothetical protein
MSNFLYWEFAAATQFRCFEWIQGTLPGLNSDVSASSWRWQLMIQAEGMNRRIPSGHVDLVGSGR